MRTVEPITYVLALNDRHTCSVIENLKPEQEGYVLVVPANDQGAEPIRALARRSWDGEDFTYTTPDGETVSWNFVFLTTSTIPRFKPAE
jgi:hypothetical protein